MSIFYEHIFIILLINIKSRMHDIENKTRSANQKARNYSIRACDWSRGNLEQVDTADHAAILLRSNFKMERKRSCKWPELSSLRQKNLSILRC